MIGEVTFGVIGLLFLFADVRTFASTFQQTFFGAPNTNLAIMATAVFASSFLALLLPRRFGPSRSLGISAAAFAAATFLATASRNNWTDLALTVIALAAGFWWLAYLHATGPADSPSPLAFALPLAFVADLAVRTAFRTVAVPDLAWPVATGVALVAALLFGAAGLAALARERAWRAPQARGIFGLLAVPCLVLVAETGATNGAQIAIAGGLGVAPEGPGATQVGQLVAGLGAAAGAVLLWRGAPRGAVAGFVLALGAVLLWSHLPYVAFVGGAVLAAGAVLTAATLAGAPTRPARSPAVAVLALSVGWILFVAFAFGFYALWALYPAVYVATALAVVAAIVTPRSTARLSLPLALVTVVAAVGVPLAAWAGTPQPSASEPLRTTFRVQTYNIHQGFNAGQIPSLDEIVAVVSGEAPDILCLQEVPRGWMIDEQHDALAVIAERLGMRYAFIPNIGDLYGNAVLTRSPMSNARVVHYAVEPSIKHQPRGVLFVDIGEGANTVLFGCTHLDEVSDSSIVRQEQVRTILREWNGRTPAIIAGDMNAVPGDIEIQLFGQSGFDDLGAPAGDTTTMDSPQKRIDYIFGKGVVGGQAHIAANNDLRRLMDASDHRSLVVNVTIQK